MNEIVLIYEIPPIDDRGYVACDCRHQSGIEDVWRMIQMRTMFFFHQEGIRVCEHCFGEIEL